MPTVLTPQSVAPSVAALARQLECFPNALYSYLRFESGHYALPPLDQATYERWHRLVWRGGEAPVPDQQQHEPGKAGAKRGRRQHTSLDAEIAGAASSLRLLKLWRVLWRLQRDGEPFPTVRELMMRCEVRSNATMQADLEALEAMGILVTMGQSPDRRRRLSHTRRVVVPYDAQWMGD